MDMVEELEMERRVDEPYALCNDGPTAEILTPLFIFKSFIVQLLNAHPEEATAPKHHRRLSTQIFETIGQSMEDTYKLLAEALKMIDNDDGPKFQGHPVHRSSRIILSAENGQGKARLLKAPFLLNYGFGRLMLF